jgi:hypothetical protein
METAEAVERKKRGKNVPPTCSFSNCALFLTNRSNCLSDDSTIVFIWARIFLLSSSLGSWFYFDYQLVSCPLAPLSTGLTYVVILDTLLDGRNNGSVFAAELESVGQCHLVAFLDDLVAFAELAFDGVEVPLHVLHGS